jgi:hypothetical protein
VLVLEVDANPLKSIVQYRRQAGPTAVTELFRKADYLFSA